MREPLARKPEEIAEDEEFFKLYGPWEPLDPPGDVRPGALALDVGRAR